MLWGSQTGKLPEINQPEGLPEISRGLSEAIPLVTAPKMFRTPEGCQKMV